MPSSSELSFLRIRFQPSPWRIRVLMYFTWHMLGHETKVGRDWVRPWKRLIIVWNRNKLYSLCHELQKIITWLSFIHSLVALQPFVWPWPLLQFRNPFYTVVRTSSMSNQPVSRPLPNHTTTQTLNKRTHKHPWLEWDSKPRSQRSSERRQFMLQTWWPLWLAS
jgi:hypothetical protein